MRRQFSRAWEREAECADLVQRLTRENANVIVVGDSGSGKSALIVDAVRQIERQIKATKPGEDDEEDELPFRHRFWLTSGARLIAGMQYLGQWEERCERIIYELSNMNGVLSVESLLDLARHGGTGGSADSLASFLIPYLQRAEIRIVTEATPAELDACRRLLPGLADLFQILNLPPMSRCC